MGKVMFDSTHMKQLERELLTPEQIRGYDVADEDTADILNTFNWAFHEGDATICTTDYPEKEKLFLIVKTLCENLQVEHRLFEKHGEILLELIPE